MRLFRGHDTEEGGDYIYEDDDAQSEASDYDDPGLLEESLKYGWEGNWEEFNMSEAKLKVSKIMCEKELTKS